MRLGILTGGGDCPGLNAVIRAAAVRTIREHQGTLVGFLDGWKGLLENRSCALDREAIRGILPRGGTVLGTSRVDPMEGGGPARLREAFAAAGIAGLIVCGGEGTLRATLDVSQAGLPVVGVPKTIDNDVPGTDYSVGFDTALETVVRAVDQLHTTAESHDRVIVVETMGRTAGWLGVCAGLAGGADVTIAPEAPVSVHEVCECIRHRISRGRMFSIVVVAEGARFETDPDGWRMPDETRKGASGRTVFGGVGTRLAGEIERRLRIESRTVQLGYVQRGGTPTAFDRLLASRMGVHAADLAARGEVGRMVRLKGLEIGSIGLEVLEMGARPVEPELLDTARVFFG